MNWDRKKERLRSVLNRADLLSSKIAAVYWIIRSLHPIQWFLHLVSMVARLVKKNVPLIMHAYILRF